MNEQITTYIATAPDKQKLIMEKVRELIHQNVTTVTEEFKWNRPVFISKKDFAYFQSNKNHVNIGFTQKIESLPDPKNILQGTGKTMRHIKIKDASEIDDLQLAQWFKIMTEN